MLERFWARARSFVLFGVAGVLALLIDIGVLYGLKQHLGLYVARVVSFFCAATFTWQFNRHITFNGPRTLSPGLEYLAYTLSMVVGAGINLMVYAGCVGSIDAVARQPAWGVALGSLAGMVFNFFSARRIMSAPR